MAWGNRQQSEVIGVTDANAWDLGADKANAAVKKSGDVMTGALTLNADPSSALGAATKQYVDNKTYTPPYAAVNKAGDTMTGNLTMANSTGIIASGGASITSGAGGGTWFLKAGGGGNPVTVQTTDNTIIFSANSNKSIMTANTTLDDGTGQIVLPNNKALTGKSAVGVVTDIAYVNTGGNIVLGSSAVVHSTLIYGTVIQTMGRLVAANGFEIESRTNDPSNPIVGRMWLRTDTNELYIKNSTESVSLSSKVYNVTIPTTGWSGSAPYTITLGVSGLHSNTPPNIGLVLDANITTAKAQKAAAANISKIEAQNNQIIVTCFDAIPTTAIPIQIVQVR